MHVELSLQLLTLIGSTFLLLWVCQYQGGCRIFGKVVAYVGITLAVLGLLCTGSRIVMGGRYYDRTYGCAHEAVHPCEKGGKGPCPFSKSGRAFNPPHPGAAVSPTDEASP